MRPRVPFRQPFSTRSAFAFPIGAVLALAAGCGGAGDRRPVYPVRGSVFVKGQPAAGARIFFSPAANPTDPRAWRPFAVVDKDGSFRLTTYLAFDGAPAGDYVVTVTWAVKPAGTSGADDGTVSPDRLKGVYGDPRKPKLKAVVKPGPNDLGPFRLD